MPCPFLAEGKSLDGLITLVMSFFLGWALPALTGLWLCRRGRDLRVAAFTLGLASVAAGGCFVDWMVVEHGMATGFYLRGGTPLLLGVAACWRAWHASKRPAPLTPAVFQRIERPSQAAPAGGWPSRLEVAIHPRSLFFVNGCKIIKTAPLPEKDFPARVRPGTGR